MQAVRAAAEVPLPPSPPGPPPLPPLGPPPVGWAPPGLTQVFLSGIAMAADAAWRDADKDIVQKQQAEAAEAAEQERAAAAAARQAAAHQQASQLFGQQWADYYARLTDHQAAVSAYRAARDTSMSCEYGADKEGPRVA